MEVNSISQDSARIWKCVQERSAWQEEVTQIPLAGHLSWQEENGGFCQWCLEVPVQGQNHTRKKAASALRAIRVLERQTVEDEVTDADILKQTW